MEVEGSQEEGKEMKEGNMGENEGSGERCGGHVKAKMENTNLSF